MLKKEKSPVITFDDTDDKQVIYGNDLKIPAFIEDNTIKGSR